MQCKGSICNEQLHFHNFCEVAKVVHFTGLERGKTWPILSHFIIHLALHHTICLPTLEFDLPFGLWQTSISSTVLLTKHNVCSLLGCATLRATHLCNFITRHFNVASVHQFFIAVKCRESLRAQVWRIHQFRRGEGVA